MNLEDLKKPFPEHKIHWRLGSVNKNNLQGMVLAYIDARDVMDRLDEVCGINWQVRHPRTGYCEIGININAGLAFLKDKDSVKEIEYQYITPEWVWRGDGADETAVEGTKGQFSDCEKRAAVQWGVGRYLYSLPTQRVPVIEAGKSHKIKDPKALKLPDWAIPNANVKLTKQVKDDFFNQSIELLAENDTEGFNQIWDEFSNEEKLVLWGVFNSQQRTAIKLLRDGT